MMQLPIQVPSAIAAPRDARARSIAAVRRWLTAPPIFARNRLSWAFSAAFVASTIHLITLFGFHRGGCLGHDRTSFVHSFFIAIGASILSLVLFPPLRVCAGLYYLWVRSPDPRWSALWMAGTQTAAHLATLSFLGVSLTHNLWVPVAVGALWGAWLPRVSPPDIS